jgi:hypothetical protein
MGGSYTTVFDATTAGWTTWPSIPFGLVFVVIGALFLLRPPWLKMRDGKPPSRPFSIFFFGFSVIWTSIAAYSTWHDYSEVMDAAREGRLQTVEGKVEKFVPMPWSGHALESFCVKNACFSYSDYLETTGFHNTASHGGPIHEGLNVRISYLPGGAVPGSNTIVKLEVKP